MEIANGIFIPIDADIVEKPFFYYIEDEKTSIHFETEYEQFGRITFSNLDSVKICRGEFLPYKNNWKKGNYPWIFEVENSKWLKERFDYEKKHYEKSYEWGGNVNEMLSDFKHYVFNVSSGSFQLIFSNLECIDGFLS